MKKIMYILAALIILLPVGVYAEEESVRVHLNGSYVDFEVEPVIAEGRTMIPFRAIAERVGAQVNYVEQTRQVIVERDGVKITLAIDSKTAEISKNNETQNFELEAPPFILQDRTLVPLRFIAEALDMDVGWNSYSKTAILIDYSVFVNRIKTESSNLYNLLEMINTPENFTYTFEQGSDFSAESQTFGVNLSAGTNVDGEIKRDGDKISVDVNILNSGLSNLWTFMMQSQPFSYYHDDIIIPDFENSINIKLMADKENVFIKSDIIMSLMLDNYEYRYLDGEYINQIRSKWLKVPLDNTGGDIPLGQFYEMNLDEKIKSTLKGLNYGPPYSIYEYDGINEQVTLFVNIFSDERLTLTDNDDGTTQAFYRIDENGIYEILNQVLSDLDEYDRAVMDSYFEVINFNLTVGITFRDGVFLNSSFGTNIRLDNIPNPYNMQIGIIEGEWQSDGICTDIENTVIEDVYPTEEEVITEEQIMEEAERARENYKSNEEPYWI